MALSNRKTLSKNEDHVDETVSFVSAAGDNASFRTVPAGKYWELYALRGLNGDVSAKMSFILADADGISQGCLSLAPQARNTIPSGEEGCWNGYQVVPENWRVYSKWHGLTGGATCNWQYIAIEKPINVPTKGTPVWPPGGH